MHFLIVLKYELLKIARSYNMLAITFLAPLLLIFILGSATSGEFEVPDRKAGKAEIAVYSLDQGMIFSQFQAYLERPDVKKYVSAVYPVSQTEFEERIRSGKSHLGIRIPEGFSEAVVELKKTEWELFRGTGLAKNVMAESVVQAFLSEVNRLQALSVNQVETVSINALAQQIGIESGHVVQRKTVPLSSAQYFTVHVLIFCLALSGQLFAVNYFADKQSHTIERLQALPVSSSSVILGKMVGFAILAGFQMLVILFASQLFFQADWGSSVFKLAFIALMNVAISMSLVFVIMQMIGNLGGVSACFNAILLIGAFLSAGFYPKPGGWVETTRFFTFHHWSANSLFGLMLDSAPSVIGHHIYGLFWYLLCAVAAAFAAYRLRSLVKE